MNGWHRKRTNTPAERARTKEYNSARYKRARAAAAKQVAAGSARCWRCGGAIPGAPWHLGHDDHDRRIIRGPEHPHCNLSAAARKGNAAQAGPTRTAEPRTLTL